MGHIFLVAYSFVAAVIGAGFASGQEILSFFTVYGKWGIWGIMLSALIFGLFAFLILDQCRLRSVMDYNTLLMKTSKKSVCIFTLFVTLVFSVCSFAVMTSCFSEIAYLLFDTDKQISRIVFAVFCTALVFALPKKTLDINGILGIIIVAGIIASTLYILSHREHQTFSPQISALVSGASYSGYNLIGAGVVLADMSSSIKTRRQAALTAFLSAAALFIMMSLIYYLLSIYYGHINLSELPMLTLAMRENKAITVIYSIMLALAVLTTAISNCVGVCDILKNHLPSRTASALVCITGIIGAGAGFSRMINTAYRACGYVGIAVVIYLTINLIFLKKVENKRI